MSVVQLYNEHANHTDGFHLPFSTHFGPAHLRGALDVCNGAIWWSLCDTACHYVLHLDDLDRLIYDNDNFIKAEL